MFSFLHNCCLVAYFYLLIYIIYLFVYFLLTYLHLFVNTNIALILVVVVVLCLLSTVCKLSVLNSHKAILCDICQNRTHLKCTPFTCEECIALSNTKEDWFCWFVLPLYFHLTILKMILISSPSLFDSNFEGKLLSK